MKFKKIQPFHSLYSGSVILVCTHFRDFVSVQKNNLLKKLLLSLGGADLVKDAGKGAGCIAFEGELAVLSRCAFRTGLLEQPAGHAVPVVGPDSVNLQCYVGGCLGGQQEEWNTTLFILKAEFRTNHVKLKLYNEKSHRALHFNRTSKTNSKQ